MYNMNISLFGMKINVTSLLFIVIILILIGHTYCGCHHNPYALIEGFAHASSHAPASKPEPVVASSTPATTATTAAPATTTTEPATTTTAPATTTTTTEPAATTSTSSTSTSTSSSPLNKIKDLINSVKPKESFTGLQRNIGEYSPYSLTSDNSVNTSSWNTPNMVVTPGKSYSPEVKSFLNRPKQPVPLPPGEMDLFFNTPFKPECCPNTYSNSNGCACMTGNQYNYLILRGGNNVPYSEY